jgi:hypothetical protein
MIDVFSQHHKRIMENLTMKRNEFVLILGLILISITNIHAQTGNIDPTNKWAWGTNIGWINFRPNHGGITVYSDHLEGYAWAENVGWIRLGTYTSGGTHTYLNDTATNYGVNKDGAGKLTGYAWGTNVGWINFNPKDGGVTIDPATGQFDGYAWAENIGWIHFKSAGPPAYHVAKTTTDSDGDGVNDDLEGTGDRDGDTILDKDDYDPTGYFYDEADGRIIPGGSITVTGPGAINIVHNGSSGYYQFFTDGTPGIYTIIPVYPVGYLPSTTCLVQGSALDPTGQPNPYVLGNGENGSTGYLTSNACTLFYLTFNLEAGDPFVFNNNFPLANQTPTGIVLSSFYAEVGQDGILTSWSTETEPNNAGFNIYRSSQENENYIKLNESLIPAKGNATSGASYSYTDKPESADDYYYKLQSVSLDGNTVFYDPVFIALTSVEMKRFAIPENYTLSQNFPNPFNPETTIEFGIPQANFVELSVYDINGNLVRTLISEEKRAGNHWIKWDARDENGLRVSSGIYFYYFKTADSAKSGQGYNRTKKMILVK